MVTYYRFQIVAPCVAVVVGLILAALSPNLCKREQRSPVPPPPGSMSELIERLQPLGLHVVRLPGTDDPEVGIFLTMRSEAKPQNLGGTWGDESADGRRAWQGTLRIRRLAEWYDDPNEDVQPPGKGAWRYGKFAFFGDRELLITVRNALGAPEESESR